MAFLIHPTAMVSSQARLGDGCEIGPHCVITGPVTLGPGVRLVANVHVSGPVEIGAGTIIYPFACLGFPPQVFKFTPGMPTAGVRVGSGCVIREHVTIHAASKTDAPTFVGDRAYMMVGSHMGHDSRIGDDVILVNGAMLAGHSTVMDRATIGATCGVHQFTRVGRFAFMSGGTAVSMDVPPFCIVSDRQRLAGINRVGLRRSGMPREQITMVDRAFREVFRGHMPRQEQIQRLEELGRDCPPVMEMAVFVREAKRAICPGPGRPPRLLTTWLHFRRRGVEVPEGADDAEVL